MTTPNMPPPANNPNFPQSPPTPGGPIPEQPAPGQPFPGQSLQAPPPGQTGAPGQPRFAQPLPHPATAQRQNPKSRHSIATWITIVLLVITTGSAWYGAHSLISDLHPLADDPLKIFGTTPLIVVAISMFLAFITFIVAIVALIRHRPKVFPAIVFLFVLVLPSAGGYLGLSTGTAAFDTKLAADITAYQDIIPRESMTAALDKDVQKLVSLPKTAAAAEKLQTAEEIAQNATQMSVADIENMKVRLDEFLNKYGSGNNS